MIRRIGLTAAVLIASGTFAWANSGMVLVESLSAPVDGATAMEYIAPGAAIDLGTSKVAVLDHLDSCTRETATGGILHVGEPGSQIDNGTITRDRFDCDGHQLELNAAMAQGGGQVFRDVTRPVTLHPMVLHGTAPMILAKPDGVLRIERLDEAAPPIEVRVPASAADKVAVDLAQTHQELVRGASYRLSEGTWSLIFSVDAKAGGLDAPLLSRLLAI